MFYYFGFGSNMSMLSLRAKGVEPRASTRAVLHGWRLRFNVQHFFRHEGGVGNIENTGDPNDRVLGVLHECPDAALALLDQAEAYGHGYDRIEVAVEPDDHGNGNRPRVPAITYVGMPQFIDNGCLPSQRYLNIILQGGREAGLNKDYLQALASQPIHPAQDYPAFTPPSGDFPTFDRDSLAVQPLYTALYGAVFDMSAARPLHTFLKGFLGGRDMTLFHLRRLDSSTLDETIEDIRLGRLNQAQKNYLNAYLNEYDKEYLYVGCYNYIKD
ncbi:gamma-glutamylcyclotransferase family protein [Halopseudomonas salegens]|uniref:Sulfite reductase (NADPH) flavoprotein alpha-component n=1 Tax=Halopseudomonas salegens TaxID=1434072 RepID=A0A1H2EMF5_9GAMM|nr:gamma-glutamylcyclotransferase family protein [Halopseudomonas salegens]SDT96290.1 sulfite reductase (NADPH) flavoprotein alpha-component [Halopseudomonas salegens]